MPWSAVTVERGVRGQPGGEPRELAVDRLQLLGPLEGLGAVDVAELVDLAPVEVDERARRRADRLQRDVDARGEGVGGGEAAAAQRRPGQPGAVEEARARSAPPRARPRPPARTRSSRAASSSGTGPSSQDSSLKTRSSPGTSTSYPSMPWAPGGVPVPKLPIEVAVVAGKPAGTVRVPAACARSHGAWPSRRAQLVGARARRRARRHRVAPPAGRAARPRSAPRRARARRGSRRRSGGRRRGCRPRSRGRRAAAPQPLPMAAERSRAKPSAPASLSSPSAAAEMRRAMSSPVTVPS